ncbi:hypothetical protein MOSE0_J09494 [Monosporozyma servazzii]|uniref:46.1 kDa protein n=1 Tax=Monosporozyma servazzii TaxID=27293 RepID=Q9HFS0_MONSE|nr:46.1 kDa protein [Kazachstania servazzii]
MVMSTSKRSYSKFLSLSGEQDNLLNNKFSIQNNNNNNNIPRTTAKQQSSNCFKLLKKNNYNNLSSASNSTYSSSASLLYLNKSNINPIESDYSDFNDNDDDSYYQFNSNNLESRKLANMRPNSFSFPGDNNINNNNNSSDEEHLRTINSIIRDNNLLNDTNSIINNNNNNNNNINNNNNSNTVDSFNETNVNGTKNHTPREDLIARERCFDYIVQAIDEVWARYCDTTSSAEVDMYDDWNVIKKQGCTAAAHNNNNSNKPTRFYYNKHIQYSDNEQDDDQIFDNKSNSSTTIHNNTITDEEYGYKTEVTEYETDSSSECRTVSKLPDSMKLESLKLRLTKAKNDLESVYDSIEFEDSIIFWKRWDMIKYSTVELMEDDDDDDVVEDAINELEEGRFFNE